MSPAALGWVTAAAASTLAAALGLRADRTRRRVARACHEVRGPLTAARLGVHLAAAGGVGERPLAAVGRELARAAALLDDLQDAPRGARPPLAARQVDLCALARDAAVAAEPLGATVELSVPRRPVLVPGDEDRLAQVLRNLLANAAEHGAGPVRVSVRAAGRSALVDVEDDGPGLPAPLAALTARASRARRGHGLAVAVEIAREHGGRLAPAPSATGARLVLELPRTAGAAARAGTGP